MKLTFDIPAAQVNRVVSNLARKHGYQANIDDGSGNIIPNPISAPQFVKDWLRAFIISEVKDEEQRIAREAVVVDTSALLNITVT